MEPDTIERGEIHVGIITIIKVSSNLSHFSTRQNHWPGTHHYQDLKAGSELPELTTTKPAQIIEADHSFLT